MRIDHVIYATADLDAAAAHIEAELGVAAVAGGRHEGLGTHNRIVPLGGGYLELLAVADPEEAAASALGRAVLARLEEAGEGLLGWAVAVDDVAPVAARLRTEVTTIRRTGLSARLAGLAEAMAEPYLPFFIARDRGVADPSAAGDAPGITWIELAGDARRLEGWLGGAPLPVRILDGAPPGVRAFGVGDRELRSTPP
jgi:Glyoxalase-like domain